MSIKKENYYTRSKKNCNESIKKFMYIYHIMFDKPIPTIAHKSNRNITHAVYNGEEIGPD